MNTFAIRHYNPLLDLTSLSSMLTEIEWIDRDGEDTSEEYLLASLEWPNYRPEKDVWVAEADGKLVGYGVALEQPSQHSTLYVVVHPSHRRMGLGSQLLELTLARAHELGSTTILINANERNAASNQFLIYHGFARVGSSGTMNASGAVQTHSFELPGGFTLKKYSEVNEPIVLLTALNDCYLGMWGHHHRDQYTEEELRSPQFLKYYQAEDILLLFDAQGTISGLCSVKPEGKREENGSRVDLLDAPGVIQKYREHGFQRQLVLAGFAHLRKKDIRPVILEFWGEIESALDIYRSLGFETLNHYITYHREL